MVCEEIKFTYFTTLSDLTGPRRFQQKVSNEGIQFPSEDFIILFFLNCFAKTTPKWSFVKLMPHVCNTAGSDTNTGAGGALPDGR